MARSTEAKPFIRHLGWILLALGIIVMITGGIQLWLAGRNAKSQPAPPCIPTITSTPTPEPIIPTPTRGPAAPVTQRHSETPTATAVPTVPASVAATSVTTATLTATERVTLVESSSLVSQTEVVTSEMNLELSLMPVATATPVPSATITPVSSSAAFRFPSAELWRLGVSLPEWEGNPEVLRVLKAGWVMDWWPRGGTPYGGVTEYAPTVRMKGGYLAEDVSALAAIAAQNQGRLWLISNEPDVRWQDNVTPDVYARLYHEAYYAIKAGDPSAVVAAGGISEPTPLRMKYLDQALQAYQSAYDAPLPSDAWHIHNYMLREERDSWGVDIPPGLEDNSGVLYDIGDSANLGAFQSQIVAFRSWMSSRGYGGQPLMISEFGIPMPADYGYPPDLVADFLRETMRYFLSATDPQLGDPDDGGRLVQRWCWFSIEHAPYPTGDLMSSEIDQWTALGYTWLSMVGE